MALTISPPALNSDDNVWGTEINAILASIVGFINAMTGASVGLGNVPNEDATQRTNHVGDQPASTISDLPAVVASLIAADVQAGAGISISITNGVLTISSTNADTGDIHAFFNGTSYPTRASITPSSTRTVVWQGPDGNKIGFGANAAIDGVDQFEGY